MSRSRRYTPSRELLRDKIRDLLHRPPLDEYREVEAAAHEIERLYLGVIVNLLGDSVEAAVALRSDFQFNQPR